MEIRGLFSLLIASSIPYASSTSETFYGVIGRSVTLSYISPTNRSIDYCHWTHVGEKTNGLNPDSILAKLQNKVGIKDLLKGKCEITIPSLTPSGLGLWKCIVTYASRVKNQPYFDIHFSNLVEAQKPSTPRIMEKETLTSIVANSVAIPSVNNNTLLSLSCCIENGLPQPTLTFAFNGKSVMNGTSDGSNFCINWNHTFNLDDNGKYVKCQTSHLAFNEENAEDSFILNILHPPTIIDESSINKDVVGKLFHRADSTTFSFTFISNPPANLSWFHLDEEGGMVQIIDNSSSPEGNVFVNFNEAQKVWKVTFELRNPSFVNTKKCYRIHLTNSFGNTWMDFSVTQWVYATLGQLKQSPAVHNVVDDDAVEVRCCILRIQEDSTGHEQFNVNLKKDDAILRTGSLGNHTKNPFCYSWIDVRFSWVDQDKFLECDVGKGETLLELSIDGNTTGSSAIELNVESPPFVVNRDLIISQSGHQVFLNLTLNPDTSNEFPIEFVANPKPTMLNGQLLTPWMDSWRKVQLNTSGLVDIFHQGNKGTLVIKTSEAFRKHAYKTGSQVCIRLENVHGVTEICILLEVPTQITATLPTTTTKAMPSTALPSPVRMTAPSWEGFEDSDDETTEANLENDDVSTAPIEDTPQNSGSTSQSTSESDMGIPTYLPTEFDLSEGLFAEKEGHSGFISNSPIPPIANPPTEDEVTEKTLQKRPIILETSKSQLIGPCDPDLKIRINFTADSTMEPNVTWSILTENGTYAPLDKNVYETTLDVIEDGFWETRLLVANNCENGTWDGVRKSYFQLIVANEYGTDELRLILDRSLEARDSSPPDSPKQNAAMNVIVPASVAGVLLILVIVLYTGKSRFMSCFHRRKTQRWIPNHEIKL